ncbi:MAG: hypothetical protein WAL47_00015 [Pyrinomonadaceae bacterium]
MRNFSTGSASNSVSHMNLRVTVSLTAIFVVAVGFSCHRKNHARTPQSDVANLNTNYETEQHAALSAIIRDMYVDNRTRLLVIEGVDPCPSPQPAETPDAKVEEMRQRMENFAFQKMPELARETIDDFHSRMKECHPLANKLGVPSKYVLVGSKDLKPLFPKGSFDRAWSRFYAKYPGSSGIIQFSNPGFNRDYTQAVVSTGRSCGGLCGEGYFILLTKDQGAWKIKTKVGTWVS